jgi:ADP-ribose pyrophosphatase YjhB (NUDIX family)
MTVVTGQEPSETRTGGAEGHLEAVAAGHYAHEVLAVVFQVRGGRLDTLLWRRARGPFAGRWSLPGGSLRDDELLGASLARHLAEKVDLTEIAYLEQLETRSDVDRDPRERTIATAYLALVAADSTPLIPNDTAWHGVDRLPATAFDHASIVASACERLRAKLTYTNVGFALAAPVFSIAALRDVYAACLGHPVAATNLQRVLGRRHIIEPTGATAPPTRAGGRPATLYRFTDHSLVVTDPFAVFRPPGSKAK